MAGDSSRYTNCGQIGECLPLGGISEQYSIGNSQHSIWIKADLVQ